MSATRPLRIPAASRRTIGAALGLALVVAAAPFLTAAHAAMPTGDATAAAETAGTSATTVKTTDPAVWVNPQDPTKSLILGANSADGLAVYSLTGAKVTESGISAAAVATGVDTRNGFMLAGSATSVAASVGAGVVHFYAIDPATGKFTDKSATPAGITPAWHSGQISDVCMYQSPVSHDTDAFVLAPDGEIEQLQLVDSAGKIDAKVLRGYQGKGTPAWDITADATSTTTELGGCVVDDQLQTLYVSEKGVGIWKFGAEPTDPMTGTLIDTPTTATPAGHLSNLTEGLALVDTGNGTGYLIASSPATPATDPLANSFMVYDRTNGNAFIRSFHVIAGAVDSCESTDGIDAAAGNFGAPFAQGIFVCQDQKNTTSGHPNGFENYKLVPLEQIVDPAGPPAPTTTTTTAPVTTPTTTPAAPLPDRSGYWMVSADGRVYNFGDAKAYGDAALAPGAQAVDLEPTPSGNGYWIVDDQGRVFPRGDATSFGDVKASILQPRETVTSISSTATGKGYWVFTTLGRVISFGDATWYGDMSQTKLNGPVLDSIPSSDGKGYYMVASDGGIFTFGDAVFMGSMGDKPLNKPVQSLVPTADGSGYWLVASDGGIFSFGAAPFRGSMGAVRLNKPVTGMVRFGDGYLMVAEDGGIFSFSDQPFFGSLGANPPAQPITSVAVLDAPAPAQ
ncbi:MAG TPA: phytase [Acidimicrobiia bacterium]|nr:phytase [Acidimicrobiia bacterium]